MTLAESASRAVLPWKSLDAENPLFETLPQQQIDICLMCTHCAATCDSCKDFSISKAGRKEKDIDTAMLREMLRLKKCNAEMCRVLKVSEPTLIKAKKKLKEEMN